MTAGQQARARRLVHTRIMEMAPAAAQQGLQATTERTTTATLVTVRRRRRAPDTNFRFIAARFLSTPANRQANVNRAWMRCGKRRQTRSAAGYVRQLVVMILLAGTTPVPVLRVNLAMIAG